MLSRNISTDSLWQIVNRLGAASVSFIVITAIFMTPAIAFGGMPRAVELDGNDPTALIEKRVLVRGHSARSVRYDGKTYHFIDRASRRQFLMNPGRYVPALGGNCVVSYAESKNLIPGSTQHAEIYDDRLYLFASSSLRAKFLEDPARYVDVDLVANGNSIVWQGRTGRSVAGSPNHTEIFRGYRYQFVSLEDQLEFRRNRARYANFWNTKTATAIGGVKQMDVAVTPNRHPQQTITPSQQLWSLQILQGRAPTELQRLSALSQGLPPQLLALKQLQDSSLQQHRQGVGR